MPSLDVFHQAQTTRAAAQFRSGHRKGLMKWFALMLVVGLSACYHWVEVRPPWPDAPSDFPHGRLRMDMASGEQMIMFGVRRGDSSLVGMVEHQSTGEKLGGLILGTTLRRFEPRTIHLADVDRIQERRQDVPASIAAGATVIGVGVGLGVMMVRFLGSLLPPSSGPLTSH